MEVELELSATATTAKSYGSKTTETPHSNAELIFMNTDFCRILPFISLATLAVVMLPIVLPAFGAAWFAGCNDELQIEVDCVYDYTAYNLYQSTFASFKSFLSFLFAAYIGSLSDVYGRKLFLLLRLFLAAISVTIMIFYANLWVYWALFTLNGILMPSATGGAGPIINAYISDIITNHNLRTMAYGIAAACALLFILFGSILAALITNFRSIRLVFIVSSLCYIILILYTLFVINETVSLSQRQLNKNIMDRQSFLSKCNPLKPLSFVFSNPIILWISIISFLITLPQTFIPILLVYCNDQMEVNNDAKSSILNMMIFASISIFGAFNVGVLLPLLQKTFLWANDLNLIIFGGVFQIFGPLIWSTLPYVIRTVPRNDYESDNYLFYCIVVIVGGCIFYAFVPFIDPPLKSILTEFIDSKEHGMAFGIVQSVRNIANFMGPFVFGFGYNWSKKIGFPGLMPVILAFSLLLALFVIMCALKPSMEKLEGSGSVFSFANNTECKKSTTKLLSIKTVTSQKTNTKTYSEQDKLELLNASTY